MTITAQSADGTLHQFPDGTDPAVVDRAMKDYASQGAAPVPAAPTMADYVRNVLNGFHQNLYTVPQSTVELGARGLDMTGLTNNAYKNIHQAFTDTNDSAARINGTPDPEHDPYFKGGQIAADILTTLPTAEMKLVSSLPQIAKAAPSIAKTAGRIADAAFQGGSAAALTSNSSDAPLADQVGLGMAGGAVLPVLGSGLKLGGNLAADALGVTTGAGSKAIKGAYNAGLAGGASADAFSGAISGKTPMLQVVADAKTALGNMKLARQAEYRSGMSSVAQDPEVLSFGPLDSAMSDASQIKTFKGQDLSKSTADVRTDLQNTIDAWKKLDPAQYHTPEGFDALKQQIGDIRDSQQYGTPQRAAADKVYSAVRNTIADQAPGYAKVMSGYSKASDAIDQIQSELSLKPNANPTTALRKLQSVMRDNANTGYGNRSDLANTLTDAGATTLLPQLSGQALNSMVPRGLAKYADLGVGAAAALAHPGTLAALPLASPRLVGMGAFGLGAGQRNIGTALNKLGIGLIPVPQNSVLNSIDGILATRQAGANAQ